MTDVRDREPLSATRETNELAPQRRSLVSRALSPIRRATGREVALAPPTEVDLRDTSTELRPKRGFNIVGWSVAADSATER